MERLEKEYEFLCKKINHNPNSKKGLDIVNHFTREERYNTKGNKGISFNEFQANWDTMYSLIQSNKNMYAWYKKNRPTITEENILIGIYRLYYGCPMTMKPIIALNLFKEFNPRNILDPCAGFGSRMLSANVYGSDSYIGIDTNLNLVRPINEMMSWLENKSKTKNQMYWQNNLSVDYTKIKYDFVFTSPPYYNIERYNHMTEYTSKNEWDTKFYIPLWQMVWNGLEREGYFCINVNREIYERTLVPLFGEAEKIRPLITKHKFKEYKENIYIWQKV